MDNVDGCKIILLYLLPTHCTLKMVKIVSLMFCMFHNIFKRKINYFKVYAFHSMSLKEAVLKAVNSVFFLQKEKQEDLFIY